MNYNTNDYVVVNGKKYYATGGEKDGFDPKNLSKDDQKKLDKYLKSAEWTAPYSMFFSDMDKRFADGESAQGLDDYINAHKKLRSLPNLEYGNNLRIHPGSNDLVDYEGYSPNKLEYELYGKYGNDQQRNEYNKRIYEEVGNAINRDKKKFNEWAYREREGLMPNNEVFLVKHPDYGLMEFFTHTNGPRGSEMKAIPGWYGRQYGVNTYFDYNPYDKNVSLPSTKNNIYVTNGNVARQTESRNIGTENAVQPAIYQLFDQDGNEQGYRIDEKQYNLEYNGRRGPKTYSTEKHAYGGRTSRRLYAAGGSMGMIPMGEQEDYNMVGAGGSHEQNPMGGVPYGMNADGSQNMVEQGEASVGNQVFSDRSSLSPELCQQLGLPEGTSPSQAMQQIEALYEQGQISDEEYQEIQNVIFQDQEMQKQNSGASYQQGGVGGPGVEGIDPNMVGAGQQFAYGGIRGFRY